MLAKENIAVFLFLEVHRWVKAISALVWDSVSTHKENVKGTTSTGKRLYNVTKYRGSSCEDDKWWPFLFMVLGTSKLFALFVILSVQDVRVHIIREKACR